MSGSAQTQMAPDRPLLLCVDDEAIPLKIRTMVLEKAGFRVIAAASGQRALEIMQTLHVDLVISDHLMPEMTGAQLVSLAKAAHPNLPFLMVSGVNNIPEGAELADGFLSKLEGPEAMIERVRSLLRS
jgi:CheY-like chemotaxis protein